MNAADQKDPGPKNHPVRTAINKTEILRRVNQVRKQGRQCGDTWYPPAPPLVWNDLLEEAAGVHCLDMYTHHYFSHTDLRGARAGTRIEKAGYNWMMYGENIGMGYRKEADVVEGWLKSPGHCKNIMNPGFKEMGVARVDHLWTQVLGRK